MLTVSELDVSHAEPTAPVTRLAQTLTAALGASGTREFLELLQSRERNALVHGAPGEGRTQVEALASGVVTNFAVKAERRREVERRSLPLTKVAAEIDTSPEDLEQRLRSGRLIGLRSGGEWLLPMWQFDLDAADPVLPGLADLIRAFPGSVVALSRWAERRSTAFAGNSPSDLLRRGKVDEVVQEAAALHGTGTSGRASRD